jgi:Zn-dependent protease with chaperone function
MVVDVGAPARWTVRRSALVVVAAVLWLATLGVLLVGVALIAGHSSFWSVNAGIGLVLLVILLRPRLGRAPRRKASVARSAAPQLWRLVDRVCAALDARAPDRIVLDLGYNASVARTGVRGTITLRLGGRLWVAAEPEQRVALLAHEFGHLVNRDPARMLFVQPVLQTFGRLAALAGAHNTLRGIWRANLSRLSVIGALVESVQWVVGRVFAAVHLGLRALVLPEHLRAEYLADVLAAETAGTSAAVGLLDRVRLSSEIQNFLFHAATDRRPEQWGPGVYALVAMRTRPGIASDADRLTLWATHPPAVRRTELLTALPWREPAIVVDADDAAALDRELSSWLEALREELLGMREFVER